jgi:hypothetical protein
MSKYDYDASKEAADYPFYALIMAAMRGADTVNAEKLAAAWPDVWDELNERNHSPGGLLASERKATA